MALKRFRHRVRAKLSGLHHIFSYSNRSKHAAIENATPRLNWSLDHDPSLNFECTIAETSTTASPQTAPSNNALHPNVVQPYSGDIKNWVEDQAVSPSNSPSSSLSTTSEKSTQSALRLPSPRLDPRRYALCGIWKDEDIAQERTHKTQSDQIMATRNILRPGNDRIDGDFITSPGETQLGGAPRLALTSTPPPTHQSSQSSTESTEYTCFALLKYLIPQRSTSTRALQAQVISLNHRIDILRDRLEAKQTRNDDLAEQLRWAEELKIRHDWMEQMYSLAGSQFGVLWREREGEGYRRYGRVFE